MISYCNEPLHICKIVWIFQIWDQIASMNSSWPSNIKISEIFVHLISALWPIVCRHSQRHHRTVSTLSHLKKHDVTAKSSFHNFPRRCAHQAAGSAPFAREWQTGNGPNGSLSLARWSLQPWREGMRMSFLKWSLCSNIFFIILYSF